MLVLCELSHGVVIYLAAAGLCGYFSLQWLLLWSTGSKCVEHRLQVCGAQALSVWASVVVVLRAQLLLGMWDLPGPGIEPMSLLLAGGFLTTGPPGESSPVVSLCNTWQPRPTDNIS